MTLSEQQLLTIREEVGSAPDDATLDALFGELQDLTKVSLAVLRPRLADALTAAAAGSLSIPGAISLGAPAQPTMLLEQVQRLEAELEQDTGDPEPGTFGGVVKMHRCDQDRGYAWRV